MIAECTTDIGALRLPRTSKPVPSKSKTAPPVSLSMVTLRAIYGKTLDGGRWRMDKEVGARKHAPAIHHQDSRPRKARSCPGARRRCEGGCGRTARRCYVCGTCSSAPSAGYSRRRLDEVSTTIRTRRSLLTCVNKLNPFVIGGDLLWEL